MKKQSLKKSKNVNIIGLAIFVVIFAVIGVKLLTNSKAASVSTSGFMSYQTAILDGTNTFATSDVVAGVGTQTVADIAPNQKLTFNNFLGKAAISQVCYYAKVYNSPKATVQVTSAPVQFAGMGTSTTVNLPADNNYHAVCLDTPKKLTAQIPYNIYNQSASAYILVYIATINY